MSNYEDIKEKIIERLPVCGTCRHMLLEVWSEDVKFTSSKRSAHIASLRRNDGLESDDPENFFVVRCQLKRFFDFGIGKTILEAANTIF